MMPTNVGPSLSCATNSTDFSSRHKQLSEKLLDLRTKVKSAIMEARALLAPIPMHGSMQSHPLPKIVTKLNSTPQPNHQETKEPQNQGSANQSDSDPAPSLALKCPPPPPPSPKCPPPPPPASSKGTPTESKGALSLSEQIATKQLKSAQAKKPLLPELDSYTYIEVVKEGKISPEMQLKSNITALETVLADYTQSKATYFEADKIYQKASDGETYTRLREKLIIAKSKYKESCSTLLKIVAPEEVYRLERELTGDSLFQYGEKLLTLMQAKEAQNHLVKASKKTSSSKKQTLSKETREILNKLNQARDIIRAFPKRIASEEEELSKRKKEYEESLQKLSENVAKTQLLEKEEDSQAKKENLSILDATFTTLLEDVKHKEPLYKEKLADLNSVNLKKVEAERFLKSFFGIEQIDIPLLDEMAEAKKSELIEKDRLNQANKPLPEPIKEAKNKKSSEEKQKSRFQKIKFVEYLFNKESELSLDLMTPDSAEADYSSKLEAFRIRFQSFAKEHELAAQAYAEAQLANSNHPLRFTEYLQATFIEIPIKAAFTHFDMFLENEQVESQPSQFFDNLAQFMGRPVWLYRIDQCDFEQEIPIPNKQNRFGLESHEEEPVRLLCCDNQLFLLKPYPKSIQKISFPTIKEYSLLDLEQGQVESKSSYKFQLESELQKLTRSMQALQVADTDLQQMRKSEAELKQVNDPLMLSLRTSQLFLEKGKKEKNFDNCHKHLSSIVFPANLYEEERLTVEHLLRYAKKRRVLITKLLNKIAHKRESQLDQIDNQLDLPKIFKDKIRQTKQHLNVFLRRHNVQTNNECELANLQANRIKFVDEIKDKQQEIEEIKKLIDSEEKDKKLLSLNEELAQKIHLFQEKEKKLTHKIEADTKKILAAENHLREFVGHDNLDNPLLPDIVKEEIKNITLIERFLLLKKSKQKQNSELENAIKSLLSTQEQLLDLEPLFMHQTF